MLQTELIGRDREVAVLADDLAAAVRGDPAIVVIAGEAGIGKTRLAEELVHLARLGEVLAVWGRATDAAGVPPFWPWRQAIRSMAESTDLRAVADREGLTVDLAGFAPEVFTAAAPPASTSAEERFRQFDAVARLLRRATRDQPVVIVLEDVHSADQASLLLLQHLARTVTDESLLLLVTSRDTQLAGGGVPVSRRVDLAGLPAAAVGAQLAAVTGRAVGAAEAERVHRLTGGNPFFVSEVGRALATGDDSVLSTDVRGVIFARLAGLSPACRDLLEVAAVVGPEFSARGVARVAGLDVPSGLGLLDEARTAGLVVPTDTPDGWRFRHALVRDAIEAALGAARQAELHRQAADALAAAHADPGPHLFDLARHWAVAGLDGDRVTAADHIRRAGTQAMRQHAFEEGARLFRNALNIADENLDDTIRCELRLDCARALSFAADVPGALALCREAMALALTLDRPDFAAAAALVVEGTFQPELDRQILSLCEKAIAALGTEHLALRARVTARLADCFDHVGDFDGGMSASAQALALAERSGDGAALVAALRARNLSMSGPDGLAEREALADRMRAVGRVRPDPDVMLTAHLWGFDAAAERGDLAGAGREVDSIAYWAQEVRGPLARSQLLRCRAMIAQAQARFPEAARLDAEAFAAMAATGHFPTLLMHGAFLGLTGHQVGQSRESLAASGITDAHTSAQDFPTQGVIVALAAAWQLAEVGRVSEAAAILRSLGPAAGWEPAPHGSMFVFAIGIDLCVRLDAGDDVAALIERLGAHRGHHVVNGSRALAYFGPVELWLGMAAGHLGLFDDAVVDLEHAVKACSVNGAAGFRVEAQYQLARVLARRAGPGDPARARALAGEAVRQADALGMPPLEAQAQRLVGELDARTPGLTRREHDVAGLVAAGLTNRQIAERLYVSERTAQNHVQHILTKLDMTNRTQIAAWMSNRN